MGAEATHNHDNTGNESGNVLSVAKPEQNDMSPISSEITPYQEKSNNALALVNDVVLKNYVTKLESMDVVPIDDVKDVDNIIMYRINKMVYEKDEYATDKFFSVIGSMTHADNSVFLIVDGKGNHTDFYIGIKSYDEKRVGSDVAEALVSSLKGQFPGVETEELSTIPIGEDKAPQTKILNKLRYDANCISSYVGVPALKNEKGEYTNATFIQGLEKFASAMHGKKYTAIILATHNSQEEICQIRSGYEAIYTDLSAMATQQLAYSTNESMANAISRTQGHSDSLGKTTTIGISDSHTENEGVSESKNWSKGESHENKWAKISHTLSGVSMALGTALSATGIGIPAGVALLGLSGAAYATGLKAGTENSSEGGSMTKQHGTSDTHGTNKSESDQKTHTDQFSTTDGKTATIGQSKNFTITIQNKHYQDAMKRIDKQLERLELCEGTGLWSTGAYFISYDTDRATAEMASSVFRSIMQGEKSGVEMSALNTWTKDDPEKFDNIVRYVSGLDHPMFSYSNPLLKSDMILTSTASLNSREVAMMINLPRKSVPGLPVSEHISLAKDVVRLDGGQSGESLLLGNIYDKGYVYKDNPVELNVKSLTQHTFVTGSTGCGKSNTIYYLIDQIRKQRSVVSPRFLIIEPAKGEYKDVFGNEHVYGTNPLRSRLLRINPFKFPEGVHVSEHIERLIEIFNVCWPMYAAMPAVLKAATIAAYENCGWDLYKSQNKYSNELFPNFNDLLSALEATIARSAYSEEVKSNYTGSLVTRVKSLTNGINKDIFTGNELGDAALFDENVIVDLSRVGSQETKSLLMGILIMRLSEYRSSQDIEPNSGLRHITILEEAHNILKRCSHEQDMEGSNITGKSVEMISNAIAEMRTYGEGFVIVDQSPSSVDISAIKNTNTKIVMRLPEENDRRIAGKSAAMKDTQLDEIAKLPTGIAVVYQNNWEDPVLCKIGEYTGKPVKHHFDQTIDTPKQFTSVKQEVVKLLLKGRVSEDVQPDIIVITKGLDYTDLPTFCKVSVYEAVCEYEQSRRVSLWKDINFDKLSYVVSCIIESNDEVAQLADRSTNFTELTRSLIGLIHGKFDSCPQALEKELCHCMMHTYGLSNEVAKKVYNAWCSSQKNIKHE
jgi:hypothetical protein